MGFSRSDVEIVVVGQGAAAGAAAWHLTRAGRDVLLLPGPAAGVAAPIEITVPSRTGTGGPAVDLADAAAPLWRAVEDETGAGLLSPTDGVDHGAGESTADLARALTARGHRVRWLTADDAGRQWPGLRFDGPVLHRPDGAGRVYAAQAARALRAAAVGRGAAIDPRLLVTGLGGSEATGVTLETARGPVRARRAVLVDTPVVEPGAGVGETVPGPWTGLWGGGERIAGFRPLGVNPCVVQDRDWPVFVRHAGPGERWPETVFGAPDPCGDVVVGFSGPPPPVRRLRGYVAELLPGLDAVGPVAGPEPGPADPPGGPEVRVSGALVLASGLGGRGTAYAPVLGQVLADLALGSGGPLGGVQQVVGQPAHHAGDEHRAVVEAVDLVALVGEQQQAR